MIKISSLVKFLNIGGHSIESEYLKNIYAQLSPEEYLRDNYSHVYSYVYLFDEEHPEDNSEDFIIESEKLARRYISLLNQVRKKLGFESESLLDDHLSNLSVSSFSDILNLVKVEGESDLIKELRSYSSFSSRCLNKVKSCRLSDDYIKIILDIYRSESPQSCYFIVDKVCSISNKIKEIEKSGYSSRLKSFSDFSNLDEAYYYFLRALPNLKNMDILESYYKYIYNGIVDSENKYSFYKHISPGIASETSEVLGKFGDYTLIFSNSKEASQYWEKGAVYVSDSKIRFDTCTSTINIPEIGSAITGQSRNGYHQYSSYFLFYLIKDLSGEPYFKHESSGSNYLLCLTVSLEGDIIWKKRTTVNESNKTLTPEVLSSLIEKEDLERVYEVIDGVCSSRSKDKILTLSPEDIFVENRLHNASDFSGPEFHDFFIEKAKDLDASKYFRYHIHKDPRFSSLIPLKIRQPGSEFYYFANGYYKDPSYSDVYWNKANALGFYDYAYFNLHKNPDLKDLTKEKVHSVLNDINSEQYIKYGLHLLDFLYDETIIKIDELDSFNFLKNGLHLLNIESKKYDQLCIDKAKDSDPVDFVFYELYDDTRFKDISFEKVSLCPPYYYFSKNLHNHPDYKDLGETKAQSLPERFASEFDLHTHPTLSKFFRQDSEGSSGDNGNDNFFDDNF
jgi:hypothetical protein